MADRIIVFEEEWENIDEMQGAMSELLKKLWDAFMEEGSEGYDYKQLSAWQIILGKHGMEFDYDLSAEPFEFKLTVEEE